MLIVNKMFYPEIGGIEVVTKQILDINRSISVYTQVLTFNTERKSKVERLGDIEVIRLGCIYSNKSIRWSLEYKNKINEISKNHKVLLYNYPSFQPEFYKKKFGNAKKIVYYHADATKYGIMGKIFEKLISKRFLSNADKIIVSNPNILCTSKVLKDYIEKCIVISYGIDVNHFSYKENNKRNEILKEFGVKEGKLILFVGRLNRYKGFNVLLEALSRLSKEYKLVVVSTFPFDENMVKYVRERNLEDRIFHYTNVSYAELPFYYSACDVFTMPSTDRAEAFGLVAVEAMACGLPVITTELGTGTSFHNLDGVTGRVIKPYDYEALAKSIIEICENKSKFVKETIIERALFFSLDKFKENWESLISEERIP